MNPTTNYSEIKGDMLFWKVSDVRISTEEAQQMADNIRKHIRSGLVNKMLVDNKELTGVWKPEINQIWENLMVDILSQKRLEKIATISPTVIAKMQIDRLARNSGTYDFNRAFENEEKALEFLGLTKR